MYEQDYEMGSFNIGIKRGSRSHTAKESISQIINRRAKKSYRTPMDKSAEDWSMSPTPTIREGSKRLSFGATSNLHDETWENMNENVETRYEMDHKVVNEPLKPFVLQLDVASKAGSIELSYDFRKMETSHNQREYAITFSHTFRTQHVHALQGAHRAQGEHECSQGEFEHGILIRLLNIEQLARQIFTTSMGNIANVAPEVEKFKNNTKTNFKRQYKRIFHRMDELKNQHEGVLVRLDELSRIRCEGEAIYDHGEFSIQLVQLEHNVQAILHRAFQMSSVCMIPCFPCYPCYPCHPHLQRGTRSIPLVRRHQPIKCGSAPVLGISYFTHGSCLHWLVWSATLLAGPRDDTKHFRCFPSLAHRHTE